MHRAEGNDATARRARGSALPVEATIGRVLVVDDEPLLARTLQRGLSSEHEVIVALNGREALERIAVDGPFDVMVCDMMMPDLTGMDVYAHLLQSAPDLAASTIFITGGVFTPQARDFLDSLPNPWMEKPFGLQPLRMAVRNLINSQRTRVEINTASNRGVSATR